MDEETLIHSFRPVLKFKEPSNGIPLFIDGSLDPRVFFGINSEFSKRKSRTNEQRNVYSTCSFNIPRVTL